MNHDWHGILYRGLMGYGITDMLLSSVYGEVFPVLEESVLAKCFIGPMGNALMELQRDSAVDNAL